jgi:hypothetical protein
VGAESAIIDQVRVLMALCAKNALISIKSRGKRKIVPKLNGLLQHFISKQTERADGIRYSPLQLECIDDARKITARHEFC